MNNLVCGCDINRITDFELKIKPTVESKPSPRWDFISVTNFFIVSFIHLSSMYSIPKLYKITPREMPLLWLKTSWQILFIAKALKYRFQCRVLVSHCVNVSLWTQGISSVGNIVPTFTIRAAELPKDYVKVQRLCSSSGKSKDIWMCSSSFVFYWRGCGDCVAL